jgi:hypothetical protein
VERIVNWNNRIDHMLEIDFEPASECGQPDTAGEAPSGALSKASDRIFLQLGPIGALGADERQWILYRDGKPVSFVRSTKAVLVRCIREKGLELSSEGQAALDALADDFDSWKANPARRGIPVAESHTPCPATGSMPKLKLIRAECLEQCVEGQAEVRACAFFACPLWAFRMGKNPFPLSEAQIAQRAKAAEKTPLAFSRPLGSPDTPSGDGPPDFRGQNHPAGTSQRPLGQLRAWAGRNLQMGSVASPDPREMTVEELEALGCTNRSPAKAIRLYEREIDRQICGRAA